MIRKLWIAILGALAAVSTAGAATVDTPPLVFPGGEFSQAAACLVRNARGKPITISGVSFFNQSGKEFPLEPTFPTPFPWTVGAYETRILIIRDTQGELKQGFCRVEGRFSKSALKVTLCAPDEGNFPIPGEMCPRAVSN